MAQALPLILAGLAVGGQAYNTNRTARRQDSAAADGIRNQSRIQRQADERVNEEVEQLAASTAADERKQRLGEYMATLRAGDSGLTAGLTPAIGSDAFREDSAEAAGDVRSGAARTAGLMSRIDAGQLQRAGEGYSYGRLATDIGMLGRESRGQQFMDELRMRGIRRNPWIDAGSQLLGGMAGGMGTGAGAAAASPYGAGMAGFG